MDNKIEAHEVNAIWTEIWHLTNGNKSKKYAGLSAKDRAGLLALFQDLLDQDRKVPPGDAKETKPRTPTAPRRVTLNIHQPDLYPRRKDKPLMWIPWAANAKSGKKRGVYAKGHPQGLVLHWTAGHRNGLARGNEVMRNTGMLYLVGDKDGKLAQSDPLSHWGYHAGSSSYPGLPGSVSNELVGLELQAAGTLTKQSSGLFRSWFKTTIPKNEVVSISRKNGNIRPGHYHAYTQKQVLLTRSLCIWLYLNNPSVFKLKFIVGHDEVSPGRKTDPGGSLIDANGKPMTMAEFRKLVANDIDQVEEAQKSM